MYLVTIQSKAKDGVPSHVINQVVVTSSRLSDFIQSELSDNEDWVAIVAYVKEY